MKKKNGTKTATFIDPKFGQSYKAVAIEWKDHFTCIAKGWHSLKEVEDLNDEATIFSVGIYVGEDANHVCITTTTSGYNVMTPMYIRKADIVWMDQLRSTSFKKRKIKQRRRV